MNTTILIIALLMYIPIIAFAFYRINWVSKTRIKILNSGPNYEGLNKYHKLISFDAMIWRWWCWDIDKMQKEENGEESIE